MLPREAKVGDLGDVRPRQEDVPEREVAVHDVLEAEELHAARDLPRPFHEAGRVQLSSPMENQIPFVAMVRSDVIIIVLFQVLNRFFFLCI